jgi:basic membrane protein A
LGWNSGEGDGVFVGNFESTDDGRRVAEEFLAEGVDVIMPVAGPVGLGTAQAVKEHGDAWIIGVDTDWTVSAPEYADIVLTSVLKNMDVAVFTAIEDASTSDFGGFGGELYVGTLENGGVGLAHVIGGVDLDAIDAVRDALIRGEIDTGW